MKNNAASGLDFSGVLQAYRPVLSPDWLSYVLTVIVGLLFLLMVYSLFSRRLRAKRNAKFFRGLEGAIFFALFNFFGQEILGVWTAPDAIIPELFFSICATLSWLSVAMAFNSLLQFFLWRSKSELMEVGGPHRLLMGLISATVYIVFSLIIVQVVFGQAVAAFALVWSGALFGLAYAASPTLAEIFAGISLSIASPFKKGDSVEIGDGKGVRGVLKDINWRSVIITNPNGEIILANSSVAKSQITNLSRVPEKPKEAVIEVGLSYEAAPAKALDLLYNATQDVEDISNTKINIKEFKDDGIVYSIYFNFNDLKLRDKLTDLVKSSVYHKVRRSDHVNFATSEGSRWREVKTKVVTPEEIAQDLSKIDIFSILSSEDLTSLAHKTKVKEFGPPEAIVRQGDAGDSMFVVKYGKADVLVHVDDKNPRLKVASKSSGEYFGEMALLTGEPRSATVRSASETIIYEIDRAAMKVLFDAKPELIEKIAEVVARLKEDTLKKKSELIETQGKADEGNALSRVISALKDKIKLFFS